MKRLYTSASCALLLVLLGTACSQVKDEPTPATDPTQPQLYLELEADEVPYEWDGDGLRSSYDYDLTDEKRDGYKRPTLNFGSLGKGRAIPVHAFFKNAKTQALVHRVLYFEEVLDSKKIKRDYAPVDLNGKYTEASKDAWYVKMFIGVYPEKISTTAQPAHQASLMTDATVNQVRILKDELWDYNSSGSTFSVPYSYASAGKWSAYNARPLPMETDWVKTSFSADKNTNQAANDAYKSISLTFRPMGSLLRVRFVNSTPSAVSFNGFSLTGAESGKTYQSPSPLVNQVVIKFDKNLSVSADGTITSPGYSVQAVGDGRLHYHYPRLAAKTIASETDLQIITWMMRNPSVTGTLQTLRPTFYTASSSDAGYLNTNAKYYKAIERPEIRGGYQNGRAYKAQFAYRIVEVELEGIGNWEHNGEATIEGQPVD